MKSPIGGVSLRKLGRLLERARTNENARVKFFGGGVENLLPPQKGYTVSQDRTKFRVFVQKKNLHKHSFTYTHTNTTVWATIT